MSPSRFYLVAILGSGFLFGFIVTCFWIAANGLHLHASSAFLSAIEEKIQDLPPGGRAPRAPAISVSGVSADLLEQAFAAKSMWSIQNATRILLLPHHIVAAREMASLVASTPRPSIVYLLAPDHFSQGKTVFTSTAESFRTVAGQVDGAVDEIRSLSQEVPSLQIDNQPFSKEHGVGNVLPFIAKAWPGVRIVPLIVRIDAATSDRLALANALTRRLKLNPTALLVSSIDFSHYLPAEVADFHDLLALDVVRSLSDLEADRVEIDSPGALSVTLNVARSLGLGNVTVHAHTNSLRLLQATIAQESTSHILASLAPGPIQKEQELTLLFLGDLMFDRNVANRKKVSVSSDFPFNVIEGAEGRFFHGQDVVVGNLEGPVTSKRRPPEKSIDFAFDPNIIPLLKKIGIEAVSQANNHTLDQGREGAEESRRLLSAAGVYVFGDEVRDDATSSLAIIERRGQKIALLGFNITDNPLDEAAALQSIQTAMSQTKHVIVFMHWGQEYHDKPEASQVQLAHWFIDHGVETVIGSHPHWMQSVEVYRGHPIVYSLGNFIFDQDWSEETNFGLVVGLRLTDTGSELHLFPIRIVASQPRLLTGEERQARLNILQKISDPGFSSQIHSGVIRTTFE